ncbi:unnamed protein product [Closterium sp. Naga37s-1]|nr:unnamed protein product [Closterium sp. Naga37s-1]
MVAALLSLACKLQSRNLAPARPKRPQSLSMSFCVLPSWPSPALPLSHPAPSSYQVGSHVSGEEDPSPLRDPRMEEEDAPDNIILRVAHLALACTATLTATRPSMARLAHDLEAIRAEVVGEEVNRAAERVDEVVRLGTGQMRTLDEELRIVTESLDAHAHADADAPELSYEGDRLLS